MGPFKFNRSPFLIINFIRANRIRFNRIKNDLKFRLRLIRKVIELNGSFDLNIKFLKERKKTKRFIRTSQ